MRPVFFFPHATIIDCGASRTTLAVFSGRKTGRLRLECYATANLAIEAGQEGSWLGKTTEALQGLRAKINPAGPVTVVLPPHLTLMKMLSTPRVEAAKRDKIITFEGQQSIPYPLTDVVWDRMIAGESSQVFNVLLCAAKLEAVDPLCAAVTAAGLAPSVLLPSVQALVAGYRETQSESVMPTLLISLGARSTTLVLIEPNGFQARTLSLGGMGVTEQIASRVAVLSNRLAQEITRTLVNFHQPITAESSLRLMITGGGARLPGLAALLAAQLKVSVELFDGVSAIEIGREAGDFNREENGATLADLIGAAALQLRAGQLSLNLLPSRLRLQAGRRKLRPRLAVAAGLAVAALVPAVAHYRGLIAAAHAHNVALERELVPLRAGEALVKENQQRRVNLLRQQEAWQKIAKARTGWVNLLGEIQTKFIQTGDVWLERMQVLPALAPNVSAQSNAGSPLRIACSGLLRAEGETSAPAGDAAYQRVKSLLENIATAPLVAAVESERFEPVPAGLLRFAFVIVLKEPLEL